MFHYEIGGHDRGRPGPPHDTVHNNQPSALDSLVNEGGGGGEVSGAVLIIIKVRVVVLLYLEMLDSGRSST